MDRFIVPLLAALLYLLPADNAGASANMEEMQQSTIRILCETAGKVSTGTGFVVGANRVTYILTNWHVVMCAEAGDPQGLSVILSRGNLVPLLIVWADADKDLAIVRSTRPLGRPAVQLADTTYVTVGAPVTVVGFPGAADRVIDSEDVAVPSVTRGNVSRIVPGKNGLQYFQHSAATNPGNSGGPVYDEAGNVIGVNSMKALSLVAGISGGKISPERVVSGEGIAAAVDVAELLPYLKAQGVPYVMASSFSPMTISIIVLAAAFVLLLVAGGIVIATPSGRQLLSRRAVFSAKPGRVADVHVGRIRMLDGSLAGMVVPISAGVILGRDPIQAQIVFPEGDAAVSRRHCEIRFDGVAGLFEVRDLGSRNGTFIASGNDKPRRLVRDVVERVGPGQKILVGSPKNRLVLELG